MNQNTGHPPLSPRETAGPPPLVLLLFLQRPLNRLSFEYIDPLGLMALAAFVGEKGYQPGVFTGSAVDALKILENPDPERPVAAVGLYCDYENQSVVESFSRRVKDAWGLPVVVGGPQAAALGREFLEASRADAVARGEGEHTLYELLECLVRGRGRLEDIKGISYLDGQGRLASTPERELISDLNALPWQRPSHSLTGAKNNLSIMTGRGCPFTCAFCNQGGLGRGVRFRSVPGVMGEIEHLLAENPAVKYLWFADDTFTLNHARVEDICRELAELRRRRDFIWFCEGHPGTLAKRPQMLKQMVEAGLRRLQIGIESGSERVISAYNKRTGLEEIARVVDICRDAGLDQLCGNIIIGGAHESQETLEETWRYVDRLISLAPGMLDISFTLFMPYPGTAMTGSPREYGIRITDPAALTSTGDYPVVETESLAAPDIARARRDMTIRLFDRMSQLLKEGRVPRDYILRHYRLREIYDISSIWLRVVYAQEPFLHRRHLLLTRTTARAGEDIPAADLGGWHPLRVMNLWNALSWREGAPVLGETVLSPLEYELLIHCSGKRSLDQVLEEMVRGFGGRFAGPDQCREFAQKCIGEFENRNWLVFTPY